MARSTVVDAVLCGPTDVTEQVGLGSHYRYLPADAGGEQVIALLAEEQPDLVAPCLYPLEQEQLLPTLALACGRWVQETGRRSLVHPGAFADLSTDKVFFQRTAERRGWPVPAGMVCHDTAALAAAVRRLELPVIIKQARSESGQGRWYVEDFGWLDALSGVAFPLLVQQVCRGEEFGLELLTSQGRTLRWPVASFGRLDAQCRPGWRARAMPALLPGQAATMLDSFIQDVVDAFCPQGPWQIDFAITDGRLVVLEINGRFSGMADLSHAATGTDPYEAFAAVCLGALPAAPVSRGVAMELPVQHSASISSAGAEISIWRQSVTATNRSLPTHVQRTLVYAESPAELHSWICRWPADSLLIPLSDALMPLERLLSDVSR